MRRLAALLLVACFLLPGIAQAETERPVFYAVTRTAYSTPSSGELVTPEIYIPQGTELYLYNLNIWGHSMYSVANGRDDRLFWSELVSFNQSSIVNGVSALKPGRYEFFCFNHQQMRGFLNVVASG